MRDTTTKTVVKRKMNPPHKIEPKVLPLKKEKSLKNITKKIIKTTSTTTKSTVIAEAATVKASIKTIAYVFSVTD